MLQLTDSQITEVLALLAAIPAEAQAEVDRAITEINIRQGGRWQALVDLLPLDRRPAAPGEASPGPAPAV